MVFLLSPPFPPFYPLLCVKTPKNETNPSPHMKRLYGDRLRKDGGLTKTIKSVAGRTFSHSDGRGNELKRVVQEVKGSIEKVEDRVTEAVGEFLDHGGFFVSPLCVYPALPFLSTLPALFVINQAHPRSACLSTRE